MIENMIEEEVVQIITAQVQNNLKLMALAFNQLGKLDVSVKFSLKASKLPSCFDIKVSTSFVSDKVKEETETCVSINQYKLFDEENTEEGTI